MVIHLHNAKNSQIASATKQLYISTNALISFLNARVTTHDNRLQGSCGREFPAEIPAKQCINIMQAPSLLPHRDNHRLQLAV